MHEFEASSSVSDRDCPARVAVVRLMFAAGLMLCGLPACGSAADTGAFAGDAGEGGTAAASSEAALPIVALARNHYCIVANDEVWCVGGLGTNGPFYDATPEQLAIAGGPIGKGS